MHEIEIYNYVKKKEENMKIIDFNGYSTAYIFADRFHNNISEYIFDYYNEIDIVMIINIGESISLRSKKENVDVSEIAKLYGGGGHYHASGFGIKNGNENILISLVNKYYNNLYMN